MERKFGQFSKIEKNESSLESKTGISPEETARLEGFVEKYIAEEEIFTEFGDMIIYSILSRYMGEKAKLYSDDKKDALKRAIERMLGIKIREKYMERGAKLSPDAKKDAPHKTIRRMLGDIIKIRKDK